MMSEISSTQLFDGCRLCRVLLMLFFPDALLQFLLGDL